MVNLGMYLKDTLVREKNKMERKKLINGVEVPAVCYGSPIVLTYLFGHHNKAFKYQYWMKNAIQNNSQFRKDISLKKILREGMKCGFTMVDTSRAYAGSEKMIGETYSNYERSQYQICTKLCNYHQFHDNVEEGLDTSLKVLGLDYVDLYLMHWPVMGKYLASWKEMERLYKKGKCKAIGVCNCNIHHLKAIEEVAEIMPMVNQIECHPLFTQNELREYCLEKKIQIMAYTSTARGDDRLKKTVLDDIGKRYKKSITQIILRWHFQLGNIPIVNTSSVKHLKENADIFNFSLTEDEMRKIADININSRLRFDSDNVDFTKI